MTSQQVEKSVTPQGNPSNSQQRLQFDQQFACAHPRMVIADGANHIQHYGLFSHPATQPISLLVLCLAADADMSQKILSCESAFMS